MSKRTNAPGVKAHGLKSGNGLPVAVPPLTPELIRPIHTGRLKTNADWLRLAGRAMRAYWRGEITREAMTATFYSANIGAQMALREEELQKLEALRAQLAAIQGQPHAAAIGFEASGGAP
jgi:hypothetical protein